MGSSFSINLQEVLSSVQHKEHCFIVFSVVWKSMGARNYLCQHSS